MASSAGRACPSSSWDGRASPGVARLEGQMVDLVRPCGAGGGAGAGGAGGGSAVGVNNYHCTGTDA